MSDGITDTYRDGERSKVEQKIIHFEMKLLNQKATRKDVETLIELWEEYAGIPRGYWTSSNASIAKRRIDAYEYMLKTGMLNIRLKEK